MTKAELVKALEGVPDDTEICYEKLGSVCKLYGAIFITEKVVHSKGKPETKGQTSTYILIR